MAAPTHFLTECKRKLIHLSSLWVPLTAMAFGAPALLSFLLLLTLAVVLIDWGRHRIAPLARLFDFLFGKILRAHERERKKLTGASYVLLGSTLTLWLFSESVAVAALLALVVSDTAAALIGIRYGRRPLVGKSVEGTAAFFISALLMTVFAGSYYAMPPGFYLAGAFGCVAATLAELYSKRLKMDDNLLIPLAYGVAAQLFLHILT